MIKGGNKIIIKKGFTLIELLIVIAIIGILAGVVMVSSNGAVLKAKRASALTTAASLLPEIVTCKDDDGGISAYGVASNICTATGHSVKWPSMGTTGWTIGTTVQAAPILETYSFTLAGPTGSVGIKCKLDTNGCCDVGTSGC